jgi:hypothetical protein
MLASKIICYDTYSNKSWCIVGQGMFALREINQREREMCSYFYISMWIPQLFATFKIVSNVILPALAPIHRRSPPVPGGFPSLCVNVPRVISFAATIIAVVATIIAIVANDAADESAPAAPSPPFSRYFLPL